MKPKSLFYLLLISSSIGVGVVWILYISSERIMQKDNPFIRSFPPHIVEYEKQIDLKFNSYYFAGNDEGKIYLGNNTAPLHVLAIDTALNNIQEIKIQPEKSNFRFRSDQLRVTPPYFYLLDGSVPCIYGGKITDWKAKLKLESSPYFTIAEPIDSNAFGFRSNLAESGENVLGVLEFGNPPKIKLSPELLQKQIKGDGIFDTDGTLIYNNVLSQIIYLYRYRNQFIVADKKTSLIYRGNTIDTISHAHIKFARLGEERMMSAPPLSVNNSGTAYNNLLFVNSALRGKH